MNRPGYIAIALTLAMFILLLGNESSDLAYEVIVVYLIWSAVLFLDAKKIFRDPRVNVARGIVISIPLLIPYLVASAILFVDMSAALYEVQVRFELYETRGSQSENF